MSKFIPRQNNKSSRFKRPPQAGNYDNMDDVNIVQSISLRQGTIQHIPNNSKDILNKEFLNFYNLNDVVTTGTRGEVFFGNGVNTVNGLAGLGSTGQPKALYWDYANRRPIWLKPSYSNSWKTINTDLGTNPSIILPNQTLNLTSTNSTINITGSNPIGNSKIELDVDTSSSYNWTGENDFSKIGINGGYNSLRPLSIKNNVGQDDARVSIQSSSIVGGNFTGYELQNESSAFKGGLFIENNDKDTLQIWDSSAKIISSNSGNIKIHTNSEFLGNVTVQSGNIFRSDDGMLVNTPAAGSLTEGFFVDVAGTYYGVAFDLSAVGQGRITCHSGATLAHEFNVFGNVGDVNHTDGTNSLNYDASTNILKLSNNTGALQTASMTTTQRNNMTSVNGMIIYNTTTLKVECYENGAWRTI